METIIHISKMGKRRTRAELICEVLESIDSGIQKPTHILYNTKVSWTVLKEMLDLLHGKNYIEEHRIKQAVKSRVSYSLTTEGKDVLLNLQNVRNSLLIDN